jgi:hypothetical protein
MLNLIVFAPLNFSKLERWFISPHAQQGVKHPVCLSTCRQHKNCQTYLSRHLSDS